MTDSPEDIKGALRHADSQLKKHDHRIGALEEHHNSLKLKCAVLFERQAGHGLEVEALRELMNTLVAKVQDNTTMVSQTRDELMKRLTILLMWIIGGLSGGALAVGVSILSWWLDKQ